MNTRKISIIASTIITSIAFSACGSNTNSINSTKSYLVPNIGAIKPMSNIDFKLGTAKFSNGFELNATWGIGSAATHKIGDGSDIFYTLTDRGVNIKCKNDIKTVGIDICASGKIFTFPTFTPTIMKFKISGQNIILQELITLKDKNGKDMTGVSNPLSNFTEKAYNMDGSTLAYDTNGLDAEALAVMKDGSFWVADEYAPSISHFDASGKMIERLIPKGVTGLEKASYTVKDILPQIISKRHANRGIESLAVSPDEKSLYFILQSPLDNPSYGSSANVRLYKMNLSNYSDIKEYLYVESQPQEFIKDNVTKTRKQKDVKVSEMTALSNDVLMVLERVSATTKLFKVDLTNAIPVPEDKSANLENDIVGLVPVSKVKVFDTDTQSGFPNKIEGIANLGNGKFLLINDNDFGIGGDKTVAKIATINNL